MKITQNFITLELTTKELRLIRKALGGRISSEEKAEAKKLENEIAKQIITLAEHKYHEAAKLKKNIELWN